MPELLKKVNALFHPLKKITIVLLQQIFYNEKY